MHALVLPGIREAPVTKVATMPRWTCGNREGCTETVYCEHRPPGWAWTRGRDGTRRLVCGACLIRTVVEGRKGRVRHTEPVESERACAECDAVFELGAKRVKRFCSDACRQTAKRRRLGKGAPERSDKR